MNAAVKMARLYFGVLVVVVAVAAVDQDLVINGGFESGLSNHWICHGCSLKLSSDSHSGRSALKVTSRHKTNQGPGLPVHVRGGTRYRVQAYVKQLNDAPSRLFQRHSLHFRYTYASRGSHLDARKVALRSMIRSEDGWFSMIGYIMVPNNTISSAELRHSGPGGGINYLLDDVSVTELAEQSDWRAEADARIDRLRKGDIHVRCHLPHSMQPDDVTIQIDHKKHLFGFGSLVKDEYILDSQYKGYQDIVYSLFNMATLQSFKWKFDKGTQFHPNYTRAVNAMHTLKKHGLAVRGHNLFWGFTKNLPSWVPSLSSQQLNVTVQDRLNYMVNITKGQLLHWDVMNELLHGQWFEETFKDPDFTPRLFTQLKVLDPQPTLMLNDFHVVTLPDITDAYLQQAKQYLDKGVPLEALGIQGHFKDEERPDPTLLKVRLDHVAQSGLPLWITEMNLQAQDPVQRAELYETAYRLFFSHPAVQGLVLWGFWDKQAMSPQAALVEGFHYKMNEAGSRVVRLLQEEWSTHVRQTLTSGSTNINVRGFKGDYDVIVRVKGVPVKVTSFSLTGSSVTVAITLTGQEETVTVPPPVSTLLPPATSTPSTVTTTPSHAGDHSLGSATSTSSSPTLHCVSRWSPLSVPGDDHHVQVTCHPGEVLTGCSSVLKGWRRKGEKLEVHFGQATCVAVDGFRSTGGVQAVAVCCRARDLTCTYRAAGPSSPGHDVSIHTVCPPSQRPLGCSAWNLHNRVGSVRPSSNTCMASNQDPRAGVYVYGACCSAPHLSCVTVTSSSPSGPTAGDKTHVQCEAGYVMTSCHAVSDHGKASGAYITGTSQSVCQAFNGAHLVPGQEGVRAVAMCCKVSDDELIGK